MSLQRIHLRKLLKVLFSDAASQRSALRADIREEIARKAGDTDSGGDFYAPFWFDAKAHVFEGADLHGAVQARIAANRRRADLYPRLEDGFLLWWNERRRWTNEPFRPGQALKAQFAFPGLDATVKIDGILSVRDADDVDHFIYPYFAPTPVLSDEAARLGLLLVTRALNDVPPNEIRILDVIRGQAFSLDRHPLSGDEEQTFRRRYTQVLADQDALRGQYDQADE